MSLDPNTQPLPDGGWSEQITTLADATIVPPVQGGFVQAAGLLDSSGAYRAEGALWRRYRPLTTEPDAPLDTLDVLSGRWMWGGVLWAHFGHFLVESTSRLWALDHLDEPVDGIIFMPKRPRVGDALRSFQTDFVSLIAGDLPIRITTSPTRVQSLTVPGQGFGLGQITAGTRLFRDAVHSRFARSVNPDGPERLYISRSALGLGKGGLLGEEHLENLLEQQGYTIFHPQKHDIMTQIARYKAARKVIAADGSALHLFAMVGRADQSVAMIMRRKSRANNLLARNVSAFCGAEPQVISALRTEWVRADSGKSDRLSFGELDHAKIAKELALGGFVDEHSDWPVLSEVQRQLALTDRGLHKKGDFVESPIQVRQRVRDMRRARRIP